MKHHILMIVDVKHFVPLSIKEKLCAHYDVTVIPPTMQAVYGIKCSISGILIYADEVVAKQRTVLKSLMELARMHDIPIFLMGDKMELDDIRGLFPKYMISYEFIRPISVRISTVIDRYIKNQGTQRAKILVVDDSGAMLRTIKAWFEDKYHIFLANSSVMAIKCMVSHRPDLILLDYDMPVCDGRQLLEMIRAEAEFADIPVMFLTNHGSHKHIENVKHMKPKGYLLKSQAPALIIKAVDDFFGS
jgi:CheY-like chemotaxis protein